mmetsp:Transcript_14958/g.29488  ORF Transcript_14958/g.29488 Transcript_14958/m.29488 type:complete len:207 (-) Transcript_14958:59-679(-)
MFDMAGITSAAARRASWSFCTGSLLSCSTRVLSPCIAICERIRTVRCCTSGHWWLRCCATAAIKFSFPTLVNATNASAAATRTYKFLSSRRAHKAFITDSSSFSATLVKLRMAMTRTFVGPNSSGSQRRQDNAMTARALPLVATLPRAPAAAIRTFAFSLVKCPWIDCITNTSPGLDNAPSTSKAALFSRRSLYCKHLIAQATAPS